jgi:hypothetical protein
VRSEPHTHLPKEADMKYFQPTSPVLRPAGKLAKYQSVDRIEGDEEVIDAEYRVDDAHPHHEERREEVSPREAPQPPATGSARQNRDWMSSLSSYAGWGLAVAVLVVAIILSLTKETTITFTVVAGTKWSVPVDVPVGGRITWTSERSLVKYEAISQEGQVKAYPAPDDRYEPFPGRLSSVRFRTAETEPVVIRVRITQQ